MTENHLDDTLRAAWTAQPNPPAPALDKLKRRARQQQLQFAVRNGVEYAAVIFVMAMSLPRVLNGELPLITRVGNLLLAVGVLFMAVQLHRRGSARKPEPDGTAHYYLTFLRMELARQQRALHSVWRWYLLPFVPGMLTIYIGMAVTGSGYGWLYGLVLFAALCLAVHLLNRIGARRLGERLADLEAAVRIDETDDRNAERGVPRGSL